MPHTQFADVSRVSRHVSQVSHKPLHTIRTFRGRFADVSRTLRGFHTTHIACFADDSRTFAIVNLCHILVAARPQDYRVPTLVRLSSVNPFPSPGMWRGSALGPSGPHESRRARRCMPLHTRGPDRCPVVSPLASSDRARVECPSWCADCRLRKVLSDHETHSRYRPRELPARLGCP